MQVLLVEPDKVLARTYARYLKQHGITLAVAHDAQGAVHAIDTLQPDLIVLELQMPRHNGIEFLYELRSYSDWQYIPVIAHTVLPPHSTEASTDLLSALGVIDYLYKPAAKLSRLLAVVRQQLQPLST